MSTVSESVGRYLCAIQLLTTEHDHAARTGELADYLEVSSASVTEMLSALERSELATYEKYHGAQLTGEGESIARELMWKHCVAENFLEQDLDVELAGIDGGEQARTLAHALSDEVALRLQQHIDHPCELRCGAPQREYSECQADVIGEAEAEAQSASR